MNYRENVERERLGEEGKNRVIAAIGQRLDKNRTKAPRSFRRVLAVGVSLALLCAVTVPTAYLLTRTPNISGNFAGADVPDGGQNGGTGTTDPSGGTTDPSGGNKPQGGDVTPGDDHGAGSSGSAGSAGSTGNPGSTGDPGGWGFGPMDPDGVEGGFTKDYQLFYGADETITLTCKVLTAHEVSKPVIEEKGFSVISLRLISAQPNSLDYMKSPSVLWTEYTYEVELKASEAQTAYSVRLTFETDNDLSLICGFWGYRPQEGKHAGEIFCSHLSGESAFRAYLNYILNAGEISEWQYEELLSDYYHSGGGVIEDTWIEYPQ